MSGGGRPHDGAVGDLRPGRRGPRGFLARRPAEPGRLAARAVSWALLLAPVWIGAGCCAPPSPPPEKFFDRSSVEETLKGFVYAIDTYQWEYAYQSMTSDTRAEVSQWKFQAAIRYLEDPQTKVPLFDLISNALTLRTPPRRLADDVSVVEVISRGRDSNDALVLRQVFIFFRKEHGEWLLDLMRSLGVEPGDRGTKDLSRLMDQALQRTRPRAS